LLLSLSATIIKTLNNLKENHPILLTGGVSANSILREQLTKNNKNIYFGDKSLSTDNAVGTALLGKWG